MEAAGPSQLTTDPGKEVLADWSPDGQRIVFISYSDQADGVSLYIMNADGSDVTRLTRLPIDSNRVFTVDWSPVE